jgi:IclR family transcriptional regulator, acetate operon repressor
MPAKAAEGTASLDKALDVLDAVGRSPAGLAQAELAERLALPRTTLYRLLGTLVARGLLRRDPFRRVYCLGFRCFEYARTAYAMPDLVAAAGAELRGLRDMTGETTYLAALDGREVVSLERCDGAHSLRSQAALGQRKPLHCTSQGKAILSALPPGQRDAIVKDLTLSAQTPRTITDRRRLQAELRLTATRGWSVDDEEIALGVRCCGAPIVDADGQVRGAISVAGPAFRLTMDRVELLGPEVAEAARRIGAQLSAAHTASAPGDATVVSGEWAFNGASPCWHEASGALWWADTLAPAAHLATLAGDRVVAQLDSPIQALFAHADGAAVLAGDAWRLVTPAGDTRPLHGIPRRRFSALCVGPGPRLWACLADGERWRVAELSDEGRSIGGWRLAEPATAMAWDATGQTLYIAAAATGTLYSARVGSNALRRLATVPKGSGQLSGLAVDQRDGAWSALRGGWSVVRFEGDGSLDRVIALPVPCPTAVGFGGDDGQTLFITTARDAVTREALVAAPLSGRLFAVGQVPAGVVPAALSI